MRRLPLLLFALAACATTPDISRPETGVWSLEPPVQPGAGTAIAVEGLPGIESFYCPSSSCDPGKREALGDKLAGPLQDALKAVSQVIHSSEFRASVARDQRWFAAVGNDTSLRGSQVLDIYPARIPAFSVVVLNASPGDERARTTNDPPTITTYVSVVADWNVQTTKAALVNTLAHEMAHLISQRSESGGTQAFLDAGFSFHPCKQIDLVSYKLGDVAECTYEGRSGSAFDACVDRLHHAMAVPLWSYPWAWWRAFCPQYAPGS
jgi:hypothetical protein